jgi:hypothetical protein
MYRLSRDGTARSQPLPKFQNIGGVGVSFVLPGMVLVLTTVNQRRSISGDLPMLIAR